MNGDFDNAIADLNESIRLNRQMSDAFYWQGKSYNAKGQFQMAIPDFTEAIRLDPEHDDYTDRAFAYIGLGEYDTAIADCTEAIRAEVG
jgi:tetratricopeptide (TPR) repeat protein